MAHKKRSGVGGLDRRPIFQNKTYTQDAGGGTTSEVYEQWQAWASVEDLGGGLFFAHGQEMQNSDYKVRVRFDRRFNSKTWMVYEGQVCKCLSLEMEMEGFKEYFVLRYAKVETWPDLS